ncbi:MAG: phosphatase PAP2 family protein [Elusimicrobia bacterium]|nr:phosphatase PAP2 family protein [Elusimicrobiota bacterium]
MAAPDLLVIFGATYLFLAIPAVALVYFLKQPRAERRRLLILGAISLPVIYVTAKLAGALCCNPRPFVLGDFTPLVPHCPDNGFPSEHTLFSAAISAVVWAFGRKTGALLWGLTALVGLSRVLAGVHHLADICGSILISGVVVWIIYGLLKRRAFFTGSYGH